MTDPIWTLSFWKVALANSVHAGVAAVAGPLLAAMAALAKWTPGQEVSIPWQSVVISLVGGLLTSLVLSLGGKATPGTIGATFIPAGKPAAVKRTATVTHPVPRRTAPHDHPDAPGKHETPHPK